MYRATLRTASLCLALLGGCGGGGDGPATTPGAAATSGVDFASPAPRAKSLAVSPAAATTTFTDTFDVNGSAAVNGWSNTTNNVGGDLVIKNGALTTPGPNGIAGIYRPFDFSGPVTMSGVLTHSTGSDNSLNRYESAFLIGTNGSRQSGYEVYFVHSGATYNNSGVLLTYNGVALTGIVAAPFQFGAAISVSVTYSPSDGRITGSVTDRGQVFDFNFDSIVGAKHPASELPGLNIGIELEFRDGRATIILDPTFDNLQVTSSGSIASGATLTESPDPGFTTVNSGIKTTDGVDPNVGTEDSTPFEFKIVYTDSSGLQPTGDDLVVVLSKRNSDGSYALYGTYALLQDTAAATEVYKNNRSDDGEQYFYAAVLPHGEYTYHFEARTRNLRYPESGEGGVFTSGLYVAAKGRAANIHSEPKAGSSIIHVSLGDDVITILPLCPDTSLLNDCNDSTTLTTKDADGDYYWLKVAVDGKVGYVAEDFVMSILTKDQHTRLEKIVADRQETFLGQPNSVFPGALIAALIKHETGGSINNEVTSGDSPFSGLMQVYPTKAKSGTNRNCLKFDCTLSPDESWTNIDPNVSMSDIFGIPVTSYGPGGKAYLHRIYKQSSYSNLDSGIQAAIEDGLRVLKMKYSLAKNSVAHAAITEQEMRNISTVYRYNQAPFRTQAIFQALDLKMTGADIRDYFIKHRADSKYVAGTFTDAWLSRVRQTCSAFTQTTFVQCLTAAEASSPALSTSAFYLRNVAARLAQPTYIDLADKMTGVNDSAMVLWLASPGELSIKDSGGNVTGVVNGAVSEDAQNTTYDAESGVATIFFPDAGYVATVKGTATGVYGLVAFNLATNKTVAVKNIPTSPGAVHTYSFDWAALARGENGLKVTIDRLGNGSSIDTVYLGGSVDDALPPATSVAMSGVLGMNEWYISDVSVRLIAASSSGVGLKTTFYSIDGGAFQEYSAASPISFSSDGRHTLQFYSVDIFGNQETAKTVSIKIDKTPPEATISIDSINQRLNVRGIDAMLATAVIADTNGRYTISDEAGHTVKLTLQNLYSNRLSSVTRLTSIQYDNLSLLPIPRTTLSYLRTPLQTSPLPFSQTIVVEGVFLSEALYDARANQTAVYFLPNGAQSQRRMLPGFYPLSLITKRGALTYR